MFAKPVTLAEYNMYQKMQSFDKTKNEKQKTRIQSPGVDWVHSMYCIYPYNSKWPGFQEYMGQYTRTWVPRMGSSGSNLQMHVWSSMLICMAQSYCHPYHFSVTQSYCYTVNGGTILLLEQRIASTQGYVHQTCLHVGTAYRYQTILRLTYG